ncbi:hypothetical protein GCM10010269_06660 [Streptomyces humidus]|uniref:Uncharacterized protein n=1 Tax=Streptomyces humidus TaxID=52259 RepID=A0A918FR18_9ACTN|nr:hypothetical protein GCM10010269_06660 [Streptomyces humidus]
MEERQHGRRGVGVAQGRYEVETVDAVDGGRVGGGVVPVEGDRLGTSDRDGPAAGGFDSVARGRQLRGGSASGGARGADDQSGAGGGHRLLPAKSAPGSWTARGFQ